MGMDNGMAKSSMYPQPQPQIMVNVALFSRWILCCTTVGLLPLISPKVHCKDYLFSINKLSIWVFLFKSKSFSIITRKYSSRLKKEYLRVSKVVLIKETKRMAF